jgi:hypothetical protein
MPHAKLNMKPLRIVLIIPDTHRPYHDRRAYALMIRAFQDVVLKYQHIAEFEIIILGDYADFYSVMSHKKDPRVLQMLLDEVACVLQGLDELDILFPYAKKIYIEGNHEFRLERYLSDSAPALFGITSTEHLLKLNQRPNWSFVRYSPNQVVKVGGSNLFARHEPEGTTAKTTASRVLCSLVYGHIHRIEESCIVALDGEQYVCFSVGWLGDKRNDKVFSYVKNHHQWQLGFGLVFIDNATLKFHHNKIHITDDYSCLVAGKVYKD